MKSPETALLAAPYDAMTRLDLAVVTKAEGHLEEARQIVHDVCNEPDEDGLPSELNDRLGAVIARDGLAQSILENRLQRRTLGVTG